MKLAAIVLILLSCRIGALGYGDDEDFLRDSGPWSLVPNANSLLFVHSVNLTFLKKRHRLLIEMLDTLSTCEIEANYNVNEDDSTITVSPIISTLDPEPPVIDTSCAIMLVKILKGTWVGPGDFAFPKNTKWNYEILPPDKFGLKFENVMLKTGLGKFRYNNNTIHTDR